MKCLVERWLQPCQEQQPIKITSKIWNEQGSKLSVQKFTWTSAPVVNPLATSRRSVRSESAGMLVRACNVHVCMWLTTVNMSTAQSLAIQSIASCNDAYLNRAQQCTGSVGLSLCNCVYTPHGSCMDFNPLGTKECVHCLLPHSVICRALHLYVYIRNRKLSDLDHG